MQLLSFYIFSAFLIITMNAEILICPELVMTDSFGFPGVNTGGVGSYIYDKEPNTEAQP